MDRQDPFENFERMFEQMRRSMLGMNDGGFGFQVRMFPEREEMDRREFESGRRGFEFDANVSLETVEDGYAVYADIPGFEKEEIDLRYDDGMLSIEGTHEITEDDRFESRRVSERVRIDGDVREDEISATYRNGVLKVHLPIEEDLAEDDARHIDIE